MSIKMGGKEYSIIYDDNTDKLIDAVLDKPIREMYDNPLMPVWLSLWAGLVKEQPEVTLNAVGNYIALQMENANSYESINGMIREAYQDCGMLGGCGDDVCDI